MLELSFAYIAETTNILDANLHIQYSTIDSTYTTHNTGKEQYVAVAETTHAPISLLDNPPWNQTSLGIR